VTLLLAVLRQETSAIIEFLDVLGRLMLAGRPVKTVIFENVRRC